MPKSLPSSSASSSQVRVSLTREVARIAVKALKWTEERIFSETGSDDCYRARLEIQQAIRAASKPRIPRV
ncbi:MAG: hypothetical protein WC477_07485 [Patescibacteria group bacterium]